jgi:hypothetical protein
MMVKSPLPVVALLLLAPAGLAADNAAKLRTLTGKTYEGEWVGITAKQIEFKEKAGTVTVPLAEVLDLELSAPAAPAGGKYADVALTDGTLLHCEQFAVKKRDVELKLLTGQTVKLPLAALASVLTDAQDAAGRDEWQKTLAKQGNHDLLAVKRGGRVSVLEGTFGAADEKGEKIDFEKDGKKYPLSLSGIHGLSFFRKPAEGDEPPVLCKVHDAGKNVLVASTVTKTAAGYEVVTPAGLKVEYATLLLLARLDFSKGKLTYLSDLEPVKVQESSSLEGLDHYRRDKNLDGGALKIKGEVYGKGLALHAYTELVYDIGGAYKDFKAVLGVDDQVGGDTPARVTIEGDERELFSAEVSRKDKKPVPVSVNVKNVKQLKIVVRSGALLDLGCHVDVADAKVSK